MYYQALGSFEYVSTEKERKSKVQLHLIWRMSQSTYNEKLEEHLFHRCTKNWQEKQRNIMSMRMIGKIALPENVLLSSFDYGGSIICAYKKHPQGSVFELTLLVIHEIMNVAGVLQRNTICTMSSESNHG